MSRVYAPFVDHDQLEQEYEARRAKLATAVQDYCHLHRQYPARGGTHQQRLAEYEQALAGYRQAKAAHVKALALAELSLLWDGLKYQYALE